MIKINPVITIQPLDGGTFEADGFVFANFRFFPRHLTGTLHGPLNKAPAGGFTYNPVGPNDYAICSATLDTAAETIHEYMTSNAEIAVIFQPILTGPVTATGTYDYYVMIMTIK